MTKFTKGQFEVDFGMYGKKVLDGYHGEAFFIYKTKAGYVACHKGANLKLSILNNKKLAVVKERVARVEAAVNWNGNTAQELQEVNGVTGKELVEMVSKAVYGE